jgi:hypothetical protein
VNLVRVVQLSALRQILAPDEGDAEYRLRQIFRWYSKTFHTPLDEVAALPLVDVLQHYYDSSY